MEGGDGAGGAVILLALLTAAAQPRESPRAFMERLYANYHDTAFSPFVHPRNIFAPRLLRAINEDSRLAHGEVGYLDGDPVCQCQDSSGMRPSITRVMQQGMDRAKVNVTIRWEHDKPRLAEFRLVDTRRGWRIADVGSADEPSLISALEASNRKARAKP